MPLKWSVEHDLGTVIVEGARDVTREDIESYLDATIEAGLRGYAKLINCTFCTLALSREDLDKVARRLFDYGKGTLPGPVAIVVISPLNLDMALLLKQRIGERPFRIFTRMIEAKAWLHHYRSDRRTPDKRPP